MTGPAAGRPGQSVPVSWTVANAGSVDAAGTWVDQVVLSPGARAHATLTQTTSGWRIELDASGLPRLDNGRFYEAWLKNQNGVLVPIGTFNQGGRIVMLWAGVSPRDFPTFTVTEESADGNQASSGRVVLVGTVTASR